MPVILFLFLKMGGKMKASEIVEMTRRWKEPKGTSPSFSQVIAYSRKSNIHIDEVRWLVDQINQGKTDEEIVELLEPLMALRPSDFPR